LKVGGKMFVSDIVLRRELEEEKKQDERLLCGCVGGAMLKDDYIGVAKGAGFDVEVLGEDREISKEQYKGVDLESLKSEGFHDLFGVDRSDPFDHARLEVLLDANEVGGLT